MKAVFAIEKHITECNPKTRDDLEYAACDITNAAIGCLISIIGPIATRKFLKSQMNVIKDEYLSSLRNKDSKDILAGLH